MYVKCFYSCYNINIYVITQYNKVLILETNHYLSLCLCKFLINRTTFLIYTWNSEQKTCNDSVNSISYKRFSRTLKYLGKEIFLDDYIDHYFVYCIVVKFRIHCNNDGVGDRTWSIICIQWYVVVWIDRGSLNLHGYWLRYPWLY